MRCAAPHPIDRRQAARRIARCGALLLAGHGSFWRAAHGAGGDVNAAPGIQARLSPELQHWVRRHTVRFAPERDYGPFCYQQADGQVAGLAVDMLRAVQARTGLQVHTGEPEALSSLLARAQAREVDLLPALRPTPERARYLAFSRPYAAIPAVLVQGHGKAPTDLGGLDHQVVSVGQGYAVEGEVRRRYPQVRWLSLPDDQQVLRALADRRATAAVLDLASLGFLQQSQTWPALQVVASVGFEYQLSFAVRSDWPELVTVLDTAIRSLDALERQALLARWLPARPDGNRPLMGPAVVPWGWGLLGLSGAAALGLVWRRQVRRATGLPSQAERPEGG